VKCPLPEEMTLYDLQNVKSFKNYMDSACTFAMKSDLLLVLFKFFILFLKTCKSVKSHDK
jgi:hypothetical protein